MRADKRSVKSIENSTFRLDIDTQTGALVSLVVKPIGEDMLGEKRLASIFDLRLQHSDYECDYTTTNRPATIRVGGTSAEMEFDGIHTERGEFSVALNIGIELDGSAIRFRSRLTNRETIPVAEFWFPRLGGITRFGNLADTECFWPTYSGQHYSKHLSRFPTGMSLGDRIPESFMTFSKPPWLAMPWFDLYNRRYNKGLYFGYHDPIYRIHGNHFAYHPAPGPNTPGINWPTPEMLGADVPIGVVYSHVRFPYVAQDDPKAGSCFESGEFVIQFHEGDWHNAAPIYRSWWERHFTTPEKPTWLRQRTAWFCAMLLQPEDRVNTDYRGVVQWAKDAKEFGIDTVEISGWDKGGQDRDYPHYVPDERLGGEKGFKWMLKQLAEDGIDPVIFVNYNTMNCETDWFRKELKRYMRMDEFGQSENWMHWGQSTIQARHGLSVRRQLWASSSIPAFNEIIARYFTRLAEWGVKALQLDKTGAAEQLLDFNPLSTRPADTCMAEGTVRSCEWLLQKCREIQPDFVFASEAVADRYMPFMDVFYRGAYAPPSRPCMRYVFPEWTSCLHVSSPFDFSGVNAAVRFGYVIAVEPSSYKASPKHPFYRKLMDYIREINRMREQLKEDIFYARWLDDRDAQLVWNGRIIGNRDGAGTHAGNVPAGGIALLASELPDATNEAPLAFSVHERFSDGRRSMVVVNSGDSPQRYQWCFTHAPVREATLYAPFEPIRTVAVTEELVLEPGRLHVLLEGLRTHLPSETSNRGDTH
ncbi:MAG: DUF6259 domain-containing protein [Kiritimatiellae bacterium]|nr:DUF6259 domain-containing protein [Kiritimatiellia bacterium]